MRDSSYACLSHEELWGRRTPVVGMIHLLPLPGSPRWKGSMDEVITRAVSDATLLAQAGVDGLLVENFGDTPFYPHRVPSQTVAAMAVTVKEVVRCGPSPVGVNILRNDAEAALSVAAATGAKFIRVNVLSGSMFTDQGLIHGRAHEVLRQREALGTPRSILADVMVKHATPPPGLSLESAARDTWFRGMADGLVLTGSETGEGVVVEDMEKARGALPDEAKLWVGSGVRPDTVAALAHVADGIIVGSALQKDGTAGHGIDEARVNAFGEFLSRF